MPSHEINIVEGRAEYGDPQAGGQLALYVQSAGLAEGNPAAQLQDMTLLYSVFDGLVRINPETMEAEPGLAESWAWSEDNLTLTFTLRDDVLWHDGSAFTATDAALTCMIYRDDYDSGQMGMFSLLDAAEAVDATTLRLIFSEPDGAFVYNAASQPMLQAAVYQPLWDEFAAGEKTISRPDATPGSWVGTGPWRVTEATGDRVQLARNEQYYDGAPQFETLTLIAHDDPAARVDGWKNGEVDVLPITHAQLNDVWQEQGNVFVAPGAVSMFAAFNFANPANATSTMMVELGLRQALDLAIDRDRYKRDVFFGFTDAYGAGIMPQPWLRDTDLESPRRDLDEARTLLVEGHWADNDGDGVLEDWYGNVTDLYLIVRDNERPELLQILDGLVQDWAEINVRVTVQKLDAAAFDARWVENRDYDLIAHSLVGYPAFNAFDLIGSNWDIRWNTRGWNPGGYFNATVDGAIQEYFGATDPDAMAAAATAIQGGIVNDPFALWFGLPQDLVLVREDVQGFNANMLHYSIGSHTWWRGEGTPHVPTPVPAATPMATPAGSPAATPVD